MQRAPGKEDICVWFFLHTCYHPANATNPTEQRRAMHYSGLLVQSKPDHAEDCARELALCPGVEVFVTDETSGRIVVVLETESLDGQEKGLRRAQNLPHVLSAELVYHYFGDADESQTPKQS
jgi:nitrate reductase NapD